MPSGLKDGDKIDQVVVVSKKVKRDFKGGTFLLFQFTDKEGTLKGVMWEPTVEAEREVAAGDVVRVSGEVRDYQGSPQLKVFKIKRLSTDEYDPALFLPASARSVPVMCSEILKLVSSIENEHIRRLLQSIFGDDAFMRGFERAPAAKSWHHSYVGGLVEHVHDMARLALRAAEVYPEADRDMLLAGVLLHDLGKMEELSITNHISYSDRGRLVGHITLGIEFLDEYLRGMEDFPEELALRLKHLVLSHHGSLENGSPVKPMTVEALLLHYIDNLDAQVRGAIQFIEADGGGEGNWTEYVRLLDRYIYRGTEIPEADGGAEEEKDG